MLATDFEISHPTPEEIYNEIDNQAPLLRDSFANNYVGLKVKWEGLFDNIRETEDQNVFVGIALGNYLFYFYSSLKSNPIFKTLKPNAASIQVTGIIKTAIYGIELENSEIIAIKQIIKK